MITSLPNGYRRNDESVALICEAATREKKESHEKYLFLFILLDHFAAVYSVFAFRFVRCIHTTVNNKAFT